MAVVENLPLLYHRQDTDSYCGPACAQMVINQIGGGIIDQNLLFPEIVSSSRLSPAELSDWDSPPDGLTVTINSHRPVSFLPNFFALFVEESGETISRKIIWTLYHYKIAPIALIYRADHWITVRGYESTDYPKGQLDLSYAIMGFWYNNPFPDGTSDINNPPPPHVAGDLCGSGGGYGVANSHVDYLTWIREFILPVPDGTTWPGKILAICDPEPAPKQLGMNLPIHRPFDGKRIISKDEAVSQALAAIKDRGFDKQDFLNDIMISVHPGDPVLVHRLDAVNEFYYIVPIFGHTEKVHALISIDARFGNYKQSCFAANTDKPIAFSILNKDEIYKILEGMETLQFEKSTIMLFKESIFIYPTLVWRPCKESLSPFMPFHMVLVGLTRIFFRMDGMMVKHLSTKTHGV